VTQSGPSRPSRPSRPIARGRFRVRLALAMLALVLAPAAIIGAFGLHRYRTALEAQAREAVLTTIDDLSQVADQEISDVEDQLDVVASILARPDLDASQRLAEAGTMLSASLSLGVVAIYDHTGQRIGALRKPGDDSAVPDVLTLPSVLATNRMFSIGTVLSSSQGPRLPVARRLVLATETWTLLAPIAMQRLSQRIARLAETRFAGAFDSLLVLDTDLHVVASPDLERVGQRIARPDWLTEVDLEALRNNVAFRGQRTTGERGAHIVAIRRLETAPLLFLAQVEEEQVLAPVRAMRTLVIAVSVGAAALACLFGLWWSRRASAPIARLVSLAEDLAAQRFDRPVDIRSGDEFETLGVAFNSAARSLADSERERANAAAISARTAGRSSGPTGTHHRTGRHSPHRDRHVRRCRGIHLSDRAISPRGGHPGAQRAVHAAHRDHLSPSRHGRQVRRGLCDGTVERTG
jgi:hypothetical protein